MGFHALHQLCAEISSVVASLLFVKVYVKVYEVCKYVLLLCIWSKIPPLFNKWQFKPERPMIFYESSILTVWDASYFSTKVHPNLKIQHAGLLIYICLFVFSVVGLVAHITMGPTVCVSDHPLWNSSRDQFYRSERYLYCTPLENTRCTIFHANREFFRTQHITSSILACRTLLNIRKHGKRSLMEEGLSQFASGFTRNISSIVFQQPMDTTLGPRT